MFLKYIRKNIKKGESYGYSLWIKHSQLPCQNFKKLA
ncbi:hypothetical protein PRO82_002034 [Candidatus Protochlamydia amoebophila]|nr:hypothetical protein [Candidatus Protochlamydia amoebophila]